MRGYTTTAGLLAATAVAVTSWTGCSNSESLSEERARGIPEEAPAGGQTLAEAKAALESIPGLILNELYCSDGPNAKGNTGCSVHLELEPDHEIVDGPELVTYVVETVWSIREGWMPNVDIRIWMTAGPDADFDIVAAAYETGWTVLERTRGFDPGGELNPEGKSNVAVPVTPPDSPGHRPVDARNLERLGEWPGDAPDAPEGLTAPSE